MSTQTAHLQINIAQKIWREIKRVFRRLCYGKVQSTIKDWTLRGKRNLEEFRESKIVTELNESSICIDCGANVGAITEVFAQRGAEVHAFEPNPAAIGELTKVVAAYPKVKVYQQAVLDKNDKLKLFMHKYHKEDEILFSQGSSLFKSKRNIAKGNCIEVEVIDLISFIENLNSPIDVLKLDVEGGEYDILLKILEKDLYKNIKHILVETHECRIPEIIPKAKKVRRLIKEKSVNNINLDWI